MKIRTVDNNVGFATFNQNAEDGTSITELFIEETDATSVVLPRGWTAKHTSTNDLGQELWNFGPA